ncbi:hypothetical protein N7J36_002462 [Escherichia coli]|nr:hypothetical protein [Escherichia coli]
MESNIKGLVAAGHEMASELKAECGAVDMRSVAKLISDLATRSGRKNITVGCHQMNRKTDTGKTLKRWPVFVDHYRARQ